MARLSGLPSEHHHTGPGDAPRRKRGRPSTSGKRPASPGSEPSHAKRTKRVQVDEEDEIVDEFEQSTSGAQEGDVIHVDTRTTSSTTRRPNRRHSEPPVAAQDEDEDFALTPLPATQPQPGLTPHLNRIGAVRRDLATVRRARMSMPAQLHIERIDEDVEGSQFQYAPLTAVLDSRTRRRLRRSHLSQEVNDIENHQKKDKKLLLELRHQLRAQDEKIKDLEYRLEARRLGDIDITDDHAEELELELEQAREEIGRLRASSLYNGSDRELSAFDGTADPADMSEDENDELLLVNPDDLHFKREIDYSFTPDGKYATRVQELSSQITFESLPELSQLTHDTLMEVDDNVVPDKIHDQAVERYERELEHYVRILAQSQGALRVVTLELQNLHFLDPGSLTNDIIVELRHGFDNLRTEVEKFFPGTTADLNNQQLLRKIPELFGGLFFELKEKMTLITASRKTEVLLRRQYEGVLDLLGESEDRIKDLEEKEYNLDKSNEAKQRTIVDLEEQIQNLTGVTADQETQLQEKDTELDRLRDEITEKETDSERLRNALDSYRTDLDKVTKAATTFEEEHHETIARMEQEHTEAMENIQAELIAEQEARDAAEGDAQQKSEYIDELEQRIESLETEVNAITDSVAQLQERLKDEIEAKQAAEGQRDEQADLAYEYANTIENLNETIADLKAQLEEAQDNLAAERAQREQTEADLDDKNEKIADLEDQLHVAGKVANELRSKLFALQQEKEQAIAQLEEESQDREDELSTQLNTEAASRQDAENTIARLSQDIEQLQVELAATQNDLDNMSDARDQLERDREEQAAALKQQLADLTAKYAALENSANSTITSLQANITDLNNQVQRQQDEINRLKDEIIAKDERYEEDTMTLQEEIADLKRDLSSERDENAQNRKEIASLSERVEDEANELLNMMNAHSEEVSALKTVIATHESTIRHLQSTATQRAQEHEDTITERETLIEELHILGTARLETIVLLEAQVEDLKAKFAAQEQDTRETIDALNLAHRRLLEENEKLAEAAKERFQKTLSKVQNMKVERTEIKTSGLDLGRIQNGKIVKTTEKVKVGKRGGKKKVATSRSWRDSGFGMDEEEGSSSQFNGIEDDDFLAA